ncbi:MAG: substrate-binding domain-containing protein [Planctomycetes bacterium]|nr:substrate-binding domain-containing protein [Planctomycetota bacterium]
MRKPVVKDRVHRYLLQKLATGEWTPGKVLPSLRKTSYELRVSHQPVHQVWQEAVEQGLLARNAHGEAMVTEQAPALAREMLANLARKTDLKRLAILVPPRFAVPLNPEVAPLQSQLVHAVTAAGTACGYECQVVGIQDTDQLDQASRIVHSYDAAFIVELSPQYLAVMTHLAECGLPSLMYQRKIPGVNIPSLTTDDYGAAKRLVELLVNNGHRNITFVTTLHYETIMDDRVLARRGWQDAVESTGILGDCVMPVVYDRLPNSLLLEKVLALRPRITGLVVTSPSFLQALATGHQFSGLRIPEDLSVAVTSTVSHVPFPPQFPPITCFEVDWQRAGQCAIEIFDRMISGETHPRNIRVPLRLQLTESIGPAPTSPAT